MSSEMPNGLPHVAGTARTFVRPTARCSGAQLRCSTTPSATNQITKKSNRPFHLLAARAPAQAASTQSQITPSRAPSIVAAPIFIFPSGVKAASPPPLVA